MLWLDTKKHHEVEHGKALRALRGFSLPLEVLKNFTV